MHLFRLPIGDWSNDGHGFCDWYNISSNVPLEALREIYFKMDAEYGYSKLFKKFEVDYLKEDDYEDFIEKFPELTDSFEKYFHNNTTQYDYCDGTEGMAKMFIFFMKKFDPSLELEIVPENLPPMFPFYGYDEKKRHIDNFGYGLFLM